LEHFFYTVYHLFQGCVVATDIGVVLADIDILTKDTLQVAMGKKYVAYAFASRQDGLFAFVYTYRCHHGARAAMAKTACLVAIHTATTGT
jgi:hypothetical protein